MTSEPIELYCENHPNIETTLRCNRCEKPICVQCAVLTPTGYRCRECVRGQQKIFETATWYDYPVAIILAAGLSFFGSRLALFMGFFTIFVAPIAGIVIAEAIRLAVRRRRSRKLFQLSTIATALGGLPLALSSLIVTIVVISEGGGVGFGILFRLLWQGVYLFIVTSTVYYRLGGIRI